MPRDLVVVPGLPGREADLDLLGGPTHLYRVQAQDSSLRGVLGADEGLGFFCDGDRAVPSSLVRERRPRRDNSPGSPNRSLLCVLITYLTPIVSFTFSVSGF